MYYNYEIQSKNAFSINLIFSRAILSKSAFINIYNSSNSFLYGPITQKDISENGVFWTDLIKGDHINIQLVEPNNNGVNKLHISNVIHGYKNTFTPNVFGSSSACNIDINCSQGDNWHNEADAVAMILLDAGTRWCTGSLLNNTAKDFRGFFLTAFHCIDINNDGTLNNTERGNVTNWLFRFRYESPTCGGGDGTSFITFNGANFRAAYQPSDMAFLELSTAPTIADCIRYAGWSKSSVAASSGTGIHHPQGDVKKISFDYNALTSKSSTISWSDGTTSPSNTHWEVGYDLGTTQGGSSGSPLFDQNHRVVGQLHGGANGCAPITKYYGRFDVSWTGGGTNDTRLSNWLNPGNSGVTTMDTQVPAFIQGTSNFCESWENYHVSDLPLGSTVNWSISPSSGVANLSTSGNVATLTKTGDGYVALSATISGSACGSIAIPVKTIQVGLPEWDAFIAGNSSVEAGDEFEVHISSQYPNASEYNWGISTIYGEINNNGFNGAYAHGYITEPGEYDIWVAAETDCAPVYLYSTITVTENNYRLNVYPNPSNNELTIHYTTSKNKEEGLNVRSFDQDVKLLNDNGKILISGKLYRNKSKITLDTSKIPNGTYYLHFIEGKKTIKKQIIIKH